LWELLAEFCNLARPRPPDAPRARMRGAMAQSVAQAAQAERLPEDVGVNRYVHHQRVALALLDHPGPPGPISAQGANDDAAHYRALALSKATGWHRIALDPLPIGD